ncbi:Uncharacterized conserved protein [Plasmopara halstedii]|uniref:Uncharacterized conserved protein n=1 Tax=Plasmopara halstedii TaxID=4781 RepID=A0A0P1B0F5_PLAHL|nr:Uncharacterized conserved protein [Plasmopara halstedii]CEG47648.1 Uncharacterized conserved protein [Plasmopara halstedii]|eukprot:XP_024584017.1 Uncharacterized conserved protein [Plasmopara halstedii]
MTDVVTSSDFVQEPFQSERQPPSDSSKASDNEHDNLDDDVETLSSEDDGDAHDAVGFGDAMSKILGQNVAEDAQPILAKRTTARMREIEIEKKETKTARVSTAEKREREQKDMVVPDHTTAVQDRKLRMIATKGVVALFNAIEKHQHLVNKQEDKNNKKVKEMSKDNFLDLLKASQHKTTENVATKSSWSVVQDDFMMGAKLTDWDKEHGNEVGRVRQSGDADVEAVEDVAWRQGQAMDDIESEDEASETNEKSKRRTNLAVKKSSKKAKRS